MRKITEESVRHFLDGNVGWRKANMGVLSDWGDKYILFVLHGNAIARYKAGSSWRQTGEICVDWDTVTTRERLNGLPGVSVTMHNYDMWLNGYPAIGEIYEKWVRPFGYRPKVYKSNCQAERARQYTMNWVEMNSVVLPYQDGWSGEIRSRKGEPIIMVETVDGMKIFYRPWEKDPAGEIHVPAEKRTVVRFDKWTDFGPSIDKALDNLEKA